MSASSATPRNAATCPHDPPPASDSSDDCDETEAPEEEAAVEEELVADGAAAGGNPARRYGTDSLGTTVGTPARKWEGAEGKGTAIIALGNLSKWEVVAGCS